MASMEFTPEEQAVIDELQKRTTDCVSQKLLQDNYLFYRFAKARDFNLAEAENMLRKHVAVRKELGLDTVTTEYKPQEDLVKYVPSVFLCFSKDGYPVRYTDVGRADCKGLWNLARKEVLMKYFGYRIEQDIEATLKRNKKLEKQIFLPIFNLEDFSYATATNMKNLQYMIFFMKSYLDNYPETLKCAIGINAPSAFIWAFRIFKQVLPTKVVQKIRLYGTEGWKEVLLELIDADVLPAFLGGNRTDPDGNPLCNTIVKRGLPIPKSCYMTSEKKKLDSDFDKLTIMPFSKEEINFEVREANSSLEWEYEIKSRDIDFSLHFKGEDLETEELIPKQRIDTCYETEKGVFECVKVGKYTLVFDNTFSWIHSKEVYLKAAIKTPNDDNCGQWQ